MSLEAPLVRLAGLPRAAEALRLLAQPGGRATGYSRCQYANREPSPLFPVLRRARLDFLPSYHHIAV